MSNNIAESYDQVRLMISEIKNGIEKKWWYINSIMYWSIL